MHEHSTFITLTYDDEHLPPNGTLVLEHYQKFMKRFRKWWNTHQGQMGVPKVDRKKIRFFHCGEYGEKYKRPHYHALIFGMSFPDQKPWKVHRGHQYYQSEQLAKLWGQGFAAIGAVNFQTAAYVARYVTKKKFGKDAEEAYGAIEWGLDTSVQEEKWIPTKWLRIPEYVTMSRSKGIGSGWFEAYPMDVYPADYVVIKNGDKVIQCKPPKYYDRQFEVAFPSDMAKIKAKRRVKAALRAIHEPEERLAVREYIQEAKFKQLKRGYENEEQSVRGVGS